MECLENQSGQILQGVEGPEMWGLDESLDLQPVVPRTILKKCLLKFKLQWSQKLCLQLNFDGHHNA